MPTITPTANNAKSLVRLDLDFTDTDSPYAYVTRVDATTGAPTAVRTHGVTTSLNGLAYSNMYAGYKAVLYDTEAPMDTPVYYTATAPAAALNVNQDFEEGFVEPWVPANGATVAIAYGTSHLGSYSMRINGNGATADARSLSELIPATPNANFTGSGWLLLAGTATQTANVAVQFLDATQAVLTTVGNSQTLTLGVWQFFTQVYGPAPANTAFVRLLIQITGTPAATVFVYGDQMALSSLDASATSAPTLLPSLGSCWLKDPLAPANNVRVDFCFDPNPLCAPQEGVFFQSLDVETLPANSAAFNVNNQPEPVITSKVRSSDTSTLTVVSRTFQDRDRLRALLLPGTPLLWQVPDEYGSPDRYISVGNAGFSRVLPDHRIPIRVLGMPFVVTKAPGGPSQGVYGARWQDSCNRYATWAAVTAAGITWTQALDGALG